MAETAKKPAIRFKGFTGAWEQRKFGDISEIKTGPFGSTLHAGDYVTDGVPIITTEHFKTGTLQNDKEGLPQVSQEDYERLLSYVLNDGDVVFSRVGSVDVNALITPFQDGWLFSGRVLRVRPSRGSDSQFLHTLLETEDVKNDIRARAVGQTMPSINTEILKATILLLPTSETEQRQIGACFRQLDHLITLHQRKYDKLVNVKKSCLEKMFPKNGSNVPEIRFSGFTEAWEQRKLRNIADKVTEKNADLAVLETFTNSAEFGIISQRDFFDHDISNAENIGGYYVVKNEDFVYNPRISVTAPVGPINRNKLGRNGVMSPLYTVFRTHDIDTTYLEWFFKSASWHDFMHYNGDSGARSDRFSIKDAVFFEMSIPYPEIAEQRKIGRYLDQLDNLITLHQRELEKLQNLKKACLEKMFV
ncbi:restriction endonuclease subunit S [Synergistes jonesii]|uniref:Type I restriction modification DNA specificity domain-containing protein n=1 Tax=Synergistes jonesii TaxID=2754 RepID=A0A073IRM9_9BACT|nr:restriction endonuclease subunit S [Synergistes jonesii]KEJ92230.1 hypothetical protein EH55_04285 [Synergistes jonesii]OFB62683.1 hypothetical protein JS73_06470 [Synergistes jonesii]OFB63390.1 hypothetical protein JS79_06995 [Synergistes jonesii]OFB65567.1 hypothetical protein JS72_02685 [Synergistes jonesii]OFB67628.1 hypothetical protein JS78_06480 [Synergistes jonesii]